MLTLSTISLFHRDRYGYLLFLDSSSSQHPFALCLSTSSHSQCKLSLRRAAPSHP